MFGEPYVSITRLPPDILNNGVIFHNKIPTETKTSKEDFFKSLLLRERLTHHCSDQSPGQISKSEIKVKALLPQATENPVYGSCLPFPSPSSPPNSKSATATSQHCEHGSCEEVNCACCLRIDLTSPFGIALRKLAPDLHGCSKRGIIYDYERYCNHYLNGDESSVRSLRSSSENGKWMGVYPDNQGTRSQQLCDRPIVFGRRARLERYHALESGLTVESYQLVKRLPHCAVRLPRYLGEDPSMIGVECTSSDVGRRLLVVPGGKGHLDSLNVLTGRTKCEEQCPKQTQSEQRFDKKSVKFSWEDFIAENPFSQLEVLVPPVVDLTEDSDAENKIDIVLRSPISLFDAADVQYDRKCRQPQAYTQEHQRQKSGRHPIQGRKIRKEGVKRRVVPGRKLTQRFADTVKSCMVSGHSN